MIIKGLWMQHVFFVVQGKPRLLSFIPLFIYLIIPIIDHFQKQKNIMMNRCVWREKREVIRLIIAHGMPVPFVRKILFSMEKHDRP